MDELKTNIEQVKRLAHVTYQSELDKSILHDAIAAHALKAENVYLTSLFGNLAIALNPDNPGAITEEIEQEVRKLKAENDDLRKAFDAQLAKSFELKAENESLREQLRDKSNVYGLASKMRDQCILKIRELEEQLRTARAEERKRCIEICNEWRRDHMLERCCDDAQNQALHSVATLIRALGDAEPQKLRDVIKPPSNDAENWGEGE